MITTEARNLKTGDIIRLQDGVHSKILRIEFAPDELIVGGAFNKTATALQIETERATFSVHPGQLIGMP